MKRRTFLGGAAVASLPVAAVAMPPAETSEEKCTRLLDDLLSEFRKMPSHGKTMFGDFVEIKFNDGEGSMRYGRQNDDGKSAEQIWMFVKHGGGDV